MKAKTIRTITAVALIAVVSIGYVANVGIGTLSAIGWSEIALLCPLGALGTMLASKMVVPQAVFSLIFALLCIIVLGRAFCAWLCPVPIVQKVRDIFSKKPGAAPEGNEKQEDDAPAGRLEAKDILESTKPSDSPAPSATALTTRSAPTQQTPASAASSPGTAVMPSTPTAPDTAMASGAAPSPGTATEPLSDTEVASLKPCNAEGDCTSCAKKRSKVDARHFVLGGSLLSAAIFGFPVFCLVCPIGLSFATILLVIRLFGSGDVTWSLLLVPFVLLVEVVLFRKWCSKLCPLSAFMSLIGKLNRTFRPAINDATCIETARGRECRLCATACPEGIDPRHPEQGAAWSECTKCRACVEACPTRSLSMPLLPRRKVKHPPVTEPQVLETTAPEDS